MDLWIRSQWKEHLIKTDKVFYSYFNDKNKNEELHILTNYDYDFGIYKTKERALEVLDEIQKLLMGQDVIIFHNTELESYENMQQLYKHIKNNKWACVCNDAKIEYILPSTIVYEMPLE